MAPKKGTCKTPAKKKATRKKTPSKKTAAKRGRPSGFSKVKMEQVEMLAKAGWTDEQMAKFYGVTRVTWFNWKKAHPDFFNALKDWKLEADRQVEKSLYQRAIGCETVEQRVVGTGENAEVMDLIKQHPPDTTACIFWLKNRIPSEWRDAKDFNYQIQQMDDEQLRQAFVQELRAAGAEGVDLADLLGELNPGGVH